MENKFTVKNFRVFNEDGATFEFKPITLLTGTNGSGKSSITKSIMLLHDFFEQGFKDQNDRRKKVFEPTKYWLDFTKPELKLGGFGSEINRNSNGEEMGFSYSYKPSVAPWFEYIVDYWFSATKNDDLKRGWLSRIAIRTEKGDRIMGASVNKNGDLSIEYLNLNLNATLGSFQRFFILGNIFYLQSLKALCYNPLGDLVDEERLNRLQERIDELIASADNHFNGGVSQREVEGAKRLISSLSAEGLEEPAKLYPHLFDANLLKAWETCWEKSILFYFPLFDSFEKLDKNQSCELLKKASFFFGSSKDSEIEEVVDDFRNSEYESFVDYFREKENEKLENAIVRLPIQIRLSDKDLIHRIDYEAGVSFDGNGLMWGGDDNGVSFDKLYRFLSNWQWNLTPQKDDYIYRWAESDDSYISTHRLYSAYKEYLGILIQEIVLPLSFADIHYVGNSHARIKRLYSFEDKGDMFMQRIERYLNAKREYESALELSVMGKEADEFIPGSFINKWISELDLGHSLAIEIDEDSLGVKLFLKKHPDDRGISLASEGYGMNQIIALLICIETEILLLKAKIIRNTKIPIIGQPEPEPYEPNPVTVIIEEPEVNLHPALQSKLADVFLDASSMFEGYKIHFIIETHSEYLIRATQVFVTKQKYEDDETLQEKNPFKVYYLPKGGRPYDMEYTRSGRFVKKFGEGFFDTASSLNLELMKAEREK